MNNTPPPDDFTPLGSINVPDAFIREMYRSAIAGGLLAQGNTDSPEEFAKKVFATADALMAERVRRDEE